LEGTLPFAGVFQNLKIADVFEAKPEAEDSHTTQTDKQARQAGRPKEKKGKAEDPSIDRGGQDVTVEVKMSGKVVLLPSVSKLSEGKLAGGSRGEIVTNKLIVASFR